MVLSGYFIKIPYALVWYILKVLGRLDTLVCYCANLQDYRVVENVIPYLRIKPTIAARNSATHRELERIGVRSKVWPVFPEKVIMSRHALHKFPLKSIYKIGMRHGPYHFKKFIKKERYNSFDVYLFTSTDEIASARRAGITNGVNGGYPKLDSFQNREVQEKAARLSSQYADDKIKLLFSATYDKSGMSAIESWCSELDNIVDCYHVFVTLHPMMSSKYRKLFFNNPKLVLIEHDELLEYMVLCDMLVSDTSSIIGEFCSLNKPIITFRVNQRGRLDQKISEMIRKMSIQIDNFGQLQSAIDDYINDPTLKQSERDECIRIMFDDFKSSHGKRAADIINTVL